MNPFEQMNTFWGNIQTAVASFGPRLLAALAWLAIAYIVARALAYGAQYVIERTNLGAKSLARDQKLGESVGAALFWTTMLISAPLILGQLGRSDLLAPMQGMAQKFLDFVPNIVGAGLIFGIGWVVATVARRAVTSVLEAVQADDVAKRAGLGNVTGETGISKAVGVLVFTLLIIPIAIASLDTLNIQSISGPAKTMLQGFLDAIPNIFAAAVVLLLSYLIAKFASEALNNLLPSTGFDMIGHRLGLTEEIFGGLSLSAVAGWIAFIAIMLFGMVEAAKLLNFSIVSDTLAQLVSLGGRVLLGSIIIGFGVIIADLVATAVSRSRDAKMAATPLKIAIIVLAAAMGLGQMGLANEIINTAFTAIIGALAVGAAIAIGWGGKDTAARLLAKWTQNL
jgi:hypothetical protein